MKADLGICGLVVLYVGNLESYQGMDLLLESFRFVLIRTEAADLVIIGGQTSDIQNYQRKSHHLGINKKVHFLGPKPIEYLPSYLSEADILVSPRIKGNNTPMKLYSYLHSGKPVLATDLSTHTQVLNERVAALTRPIPEEFAIGMLRLVRDKELRLELGTAGKRLVEEKFTYNAFREKVNGLYDWLETEVEDPYLEQKKANIAHKGLEA